VGSTAFCLLAWSLIGSLAHAHTCRCWLSVAAAAVVCYACTLHSAMPPRSCALVPGAEGCVAACMMPSPSPKPTRYLAPEVVQQRGHSAAADLWALGCLLHALLTGETPFAQPGDDELRIYRRICAGCVGHHDEGAGPHDTGFPPLTPGSLPPGAEALVRALLVPEPSVRLGAGPGGFADLKSHPWFAPIDWDALLEQR
jgi:serine/threonine protein kinase